MLIYNAFIDAVCGFEIFSSGLTVSVLQFSKHNLSLFLYDFSKDTLIR